MSKIGEKEKHPDCFGILDSVFPKGEDGFRNTPESCFACFCKVECLKNAVHGPSGLKIEEEIIDRAYHAGAISFMERWSKKKNISRRRNKIKNTRSNS